MSAIAITPCRAACRTYPPAPDQRARIAAMPAAAAHAPARRAAPLLDRSVSSSAYLAPIRLHGMSAFVL